MRTILTVALVVCTLVAALTSLPSAAARPAGASTGAGARPAAPEPPPQHVVVDTFYVTVGIEVDDRLLPFEDDVEFRATRLAPGVRLDRKGNLRGRPQRPGTFVTPVRLCRDGRCVEQRITVLSYPNESWRARQLTFTGRVGVPLHGYIGVEGGPAGVPATFTVTNGLPRGVSIGPDGQVGGVPVAPGVSRVPVRVCVAGNCSGVVVTLIVT